MSYSVQNIITWAKASQALSAIGESKKRAQIGGEIDQDLHIKLLVERSILEETYDADPTDTLDVQYGIGNYVYALCGTYAFTAQDATGGGSSSGTTTPSTTPLPIEFTVTSNSYIIDGQSSKIISSFIGFNLIFVRNNITQSTIDNCGTYYSWDKNSGLFTCYGSAQALELFQFYAV